MDTIQVQMKCLDSFEIYIMYDQKTSCLIHFLVADLYCTTSRWMYQCIKTNTQQRAAPHYEDKTAAHSYWFKSGAKDWAMPF